MVVGGGGRSPRASAAGDGRCRRHRGRWARSDTRRRGRTRRGGPTGHHVPRHARDGRGRRARRRDRHPWLGPRTTPGRPMAGTARAGHSRPRALVPDDLGVAGVPTDGGGGRATGAGSGTARSRRDPAVDGSARGATTTASLVGRRRRHADRRCCRGPRGAGRHPRRRGHERRVRELPGCRPDRGR